MPIELETPGPNTTEKTPANSQITEHKTPCPNCGAVVILFPRTIQTFCYRCGMAVTKLDQDGLYYEVITPGGK